MWFVFSAFIRMTGLYYQLSAQCTRLEIPSSSCCASGDGEKGPGEPQTRETTRNASGSVKQAFKSCSMIINIGHYHQIPTTYISQVSLGSLHQRMNEMFETAIRSLYQAGKIIVLPPNFVGQFSSPLSQIRPTNPRSRASLSRMSWPFSSGSR